MDAVIRKAIEAKLASMGIDWLKLQSLHLDRATKTLDAEVVLEGESEPVRLSVHYSLDGGDIVVGSVQTSKPWMSRLASLGLEKQGGRFPLPGGIQGTMIRGML